MTGGKLRNAAESQRKVMRQNVSAESRHEPVGQNSGRSRNIQENARRRRNQERTTPE